MLVSETVLVVASLRICTSLVGRTGWRTVLLGPVLAGRGVGGARWSPVGGGLLIGLPVGVVAYGVALLAVERLTSPGDLQFALALLRRRSGVPGRGSDDIP